MKRRETKINLDFIGELPAVEDSLWNLAITLEMLLQPGLAEPEINRLTKRMKPQQVYHRIFEKYTHYKRLELEMRELAKKYREMTTQS